MNFHILSFTCAVILCSAAHIPLVSSRCNVSPTYDVEAHEQYMERFRQSRVTTGLTEYQVPVVFHVVMNDAGKSNVSDGKISEQLCLLNQAFAASSSFPNGTGFAFYLREIRRYTNDAYANNCGNGTEMFTETIDPERTLNVFICKRIGGENAEKLLGVAKLPDEDSGGPDDVIIITKCSMPRGCTTYYNHGDTLIHEVGHYFGLYHTFEGLDCEGSGDRVTDTPPQSEPTNSREVKLLGIAVGNDLCPTDKDSCGGDEFLDPVKNFMDYTPDCCIDRFTVGQVARMQNEVAAFRPNLGANQTSTGNYGDEECNDAPSCKQDVLNAAAASSLTPQASSWLLAWNAFFPLER